MKLINKTFIYLYENFIKILVYLIIRIDIIKNFLQK